MSWGTELWDQYENLSLHTQKGIDFLEKYSHFIKDRCAIEVEYATKLRRLVKNYQPKKKDEEDYQYSPCKAFKLVMSEVNDLAGQHEVIAENLQAQVIREVTNLVKEFKDERKKLLNEGARMMTQLSTQINNLERSRKNYEKASKEAERATDSFKRADADLNLSRAEVEKQKMNMNIKQQQCEDAKNEYANQLQRTNEQQRQHYQHLMPEIFRQLQELDENRIRQIRNFMIHSVEVERSVFPIINQCLDGIVTAAKQIDEKEDTNQVIEKYKSGFEPPADFPFDDLSRPEGIHYTPPITVRPDTIKGTMSFKNGKKRGGLFTLFYSSNKNNISGNGEKQDDFSDLPPNQKKNKLQSKIDEILRKINQETATRDGLMKMKGVYEQNSELGDPMTVEGQLAENGQRLDKLRQELHVYQSRLEDMNTNQNNSLNHTPLHNTVNELRRPHRLEKEWSRLRSSLRLPRSKNSGGSGGDEDSLSRSASDSSVSANHNHKHSAPGTPLPSHGCSSDSPESGIAGSHTSLSDDPPPPYYDSELLPPLGTCRALYPFEATSEGSMAMSDGEELLVIEVDQGDGWTRVRRPADQMEGFVPTTYIQCFLNNC